MGGTDCDAPSHDRFCRPSECSRKATDPSPVRYHAVCNNLNQVPPTVADHADTAYTVVHAVILLAQYGPTSECTGGHEGNGTRILDAASEEWRAFPKATLSPYQDSTQARAVPWSLRLVSSMTRIPRAPVLQEPVSSPRLFPPPSERWIYQIGVKVQRQVRLCDKPLPIVCCCRQCEWKLL